MAQEKGRVACFQLSASRGASEHPGTLAREAEHVLYGTDVVVLRSLSLFRRQKQADMPDHFRDAIGGVVGGYQANRQDRRDIAKLLGVSA